MNPRYSPRRKPYARTRFDVAGASNGLRMRRERRPVGLSATAVLGLMAVGALAVFAAAGVHWFMGDAFRIAPAMLQVRNSENVPKERLIAASGLLGEHVLLVDLDAAAARVDDQAGVDAVRITCHWNGRASCDILVKTSNALAVLQTADGPVWIDAAGKVQQAMGDLPAGLRVKVEGRDAPKPGSAVDGRLVSTLLELKHIQPEVAQYGYSPAFGVTWTDPQGWKIRLGYAERPGEMREKLELKRRLQAELSAAQTTPGVIDVRYVDAPYYISVDR